jgi:hypothetical protein
MICSDLYLDFFSDSILSRNAKKKIFFHIIFSWANEISVLGGFEALRAYPDLLSSVKHMFEKKEDVRQPCFIASREDTM